MWACPARLPAQPARIGRTRHSRARALRALVGRREADSLRTSGVPNPANDRVSVRLPSNTGTLQMYNAFGKLVRTLAVKEVNIDINTSILPNGLYLLQHVTPEGARSETQLIIQH